MKKRDELTDPTSCMTLTPQHLESVGMVEVKPEVWARKEAGT